MHYRLPYFLARFIIGTSMFSHGLVRIPKLEKFSAGLVNEFQKSILPEASVRAFSYVLPFVELITGILLILGLFTRAGLILGTVVMIALVFGSGTIEDWASIPSQLIHAAFFIVLLVYLPYNDYSIDKRLMKK